MRDREPPGLELRETTSLRSAATRVLDPCRNRYLRELDDEEPSLFARILGEVRRRQGSNRL